jgi:hypothetical protein
MLDGRIHLTESPPWLNELIPLDGKYYVVFPPMPAIISIPFVFVLGDKFEQQFLAHMLGAGIAILTYLLAIKIRKNKSIALWMLLLSGFGTIIWFMSANGSVWYTGQLSAVFFLMASINEIFGKKRPLVVGLLFGAAYLSRIHILFAVLPICFFLIKGQIFKMNNLKNIALIALGLSPFVLFNALYNFARFGVWWDKGYALIPGVLDEPWYEFGLVHPSYIPRHLKVMFTALPVFQKDFPYILPSLAGLATWITTPAFVFSLFAPIKKLAVRISIVAMLLISIPIFMHGTTGFAQFGYRYILELYPFIFLILIHALPDKLRSWHWALLLISILVNLWGVLWINKFGWVE